MAAATIPISKTTLVEDDPRRVLPETELARFHKLKAKLEILRLSIEDIKESVAFHGTELGEFGPEGPKSASYNARSSNAITRRSGLIGFEEARRLVKADLENAERTLERSLSEQEATQQEMVALRSKLTKIARRYLREQQAELFKEAEMVAAKSHAVDEFDAGCTRLGIHPGGDHSDPAFYGGLSFFRSGDGMIDGNGRRRLGSGKSPFQIEVARKLTR